MPQQPRQGGVAVGVPFASNRALSRSIVSNVQLRIGTRRYGPRNHGHIVAGGGHYFLRALGERGKDTSNVHIDLGSLTSFHLHAVAATRADH